MSTCAGITKKESRYRGVRRVRWNTGRAWISRRSSPKKRPHPPPGEPGHIRKSGHALPPGSHELAADRVVHRAAHAVGEGPRGDLHLGGAFDDPRVRRRHSAKSEQGGVDVSDDGGGQERTSRGQPSRARGSGERIRDLSDGAVLFPPPLPATKSSSSSGH